MSKMLVKYLLPGTAISHPIKDQDGKVLLESGIKLTEADIQSLIDQNIVVVFVDKDDLFKLRGKAELDKERLLNSLEYKTPLIKDIPPVVSEAIQRAAIDAVHNVIHDMQQGKPVDIAQSQEVVDGMVTEIIQNRDAMVNLIDIKTFDDYTFSHSVNVAVLSILIAAEMKISAEQIKDFGVGALLHDVGKVEIQDEILNKRGALTDEEFLEMKKHPIFSRKILQQDSKISDAAISVAFQHHEKFNGKGYPQGISGEGIGLFARIAAVADVYDALTSDRIYRPKMEPYKAMKIILSNNGTHFDPSIVEVFVRHMSVYPIESMVKLSSGEIAIVIRSNEHSLIAPVIRLLFDAKGNKISDKTEIDLSHDPRYIKGLVLEGGIVS